MVQVRTATMAPKAEASPTLRCRSLRLRRMSSMLCRRTVPMAASQSGHCTPVVFVLCREVNGTAHISHGQALHCGTRCGHLHLGNSDQVA